ncbi:hypothetical protein [Microbulbifer halophilus]|uniref:hypothetical protein n=1 Tax=Microbulbifer halophilus TaxID=453963 RepID=UPI0036120EA8
MTKYLPAGASRMRAVGDVDGSFTSATAREDSAYQQGRVGNGLAGSRPLKRCRPA